MSKNVTNKCEKPQWKCTIGGQVGMVGRCCGLDTRKPLNDVARKDELRNAMKEVRLISVNGINSDGSKENYDKQKKEVTHGIINDIINNTNPVA